MKVFISWSGTTSHKVAKVLREWLPSVIQTIEPYVSSEDIDKGARWSSDIAGELDDSSFGILCVTSDNVAAPWLNFEAGALGKSVDKSRVCPILYHIKRSEVEGPLLQFQSTIIERDDVFRLLESINEASGSEGIETARLEKAFDVWWTDLKDQLAKIDPPTHTSDDEIVDSKESATSDLLEELLELTRVNHKLLRDPEALLPAGYIEHALRKISPRRISRLLDEDAYDRVDRIHPEAIAEAVICYREILKAVALIEQTPELDEVLHAIRKMDRPMRYMSKHIDMRLPREVLEEMRKEI